MMLLLCVSPSHNSKVLFAFAKGIDNFNKTELRLKPSFTHLSFFQLYLHLAPELRDDHQHAAATI